MNLHGSKASLGITSRNHDYGARGSEPITRGESKGTIGGRIARIVASMEKMPFGTQADQSGPDSNKIRNRRTERSDEFSRLYATLSSVNWSDREQLKNNYSTPRNDPNASQALNPKTGDRSEYKAGLFARIVKHKNVQNEPSHTHSLSSLAAPAKNGKGVGGASPLEQRLQKIFGRSQFLENYRNQAIGTSFTNHIINYFPIFKLSDKPRNILDMNSKPFPNSWQVNKADFLARIVKSTKMIRGGQSKTHHRSKFAAPVKQRERVGGVSPLKKLQSAVEHFSVLWSSNKLTNKLIARGLFSQIDRGFPMYTLSEKTRNAPLDAAIKHIEKFQKLVRLTAKNKPFDTATAVTASLKNDHGAMIDPTSLKEQNRHSDKDHYAEIKRLQSGGLTRREKNSLLNTDIKLDELEWTGRIKEAITSILFKGHVNTIGDLIKEQIKHPDLKINSPIYRLLMENLPIKPKAFPRKDLLDLVNEKYPESAIPNSVSDEKTLLEASRGPILLLQILQGKFDVEKNGKFDLEASKEALSSAIG